MSGFINNASAATPQVSGYGTIAIPTPGSSGTLLSQSAQNFPGQEDRGGTDKIPWSKLSNDEKNQIMKDAQSPKTEGDYNKYDEFLSQKGTVILPDKKIFGPKEWQDKLFSPDQVERYDLPDGRVILRLKNKKAPLVS